MTRDSMPQIDLAPLRQPPPKRRRFSRAVLAGPRWLWFRTKEAGNFGDIQEGGRLIRELATAVRHGPSAPSRLYADADQRLDMKATALSHGLSTASLEERLLQRRHQTTCMAYSAFAGGWLSLGWWLWQALTTPWSTGRVVLGLEFLPFCAVFFLLAFKAAWQNWQLRTRRLGSAMEYLTTTERFWPG